MNRMDRIRPENGTGRQTGEPDMAKRLTGIKMKTKNGRNGTHGTNGQDGQDGRGKAEGTSYQ